MFDAQGQGIAQATAPSASRLNTRRACEWNGLEVISA